MKCLSERSHSRLLGWSLVCFVLVAFRPQLTAAQEILVDLDGGHLFGLDVPPPPGTELVPFNLTVPLDENKRIINGTMLGGISGNWEETYEISVFGQLTFGPDFPLEPEIYLGYWWSFNVYGLLVFENAETTFIGHSGEVIVHVSSSGEIRVEPGVSLMMPFIGSDGVIRVCENASFRAHDDSGVTGNGLVIVEDGGAFTGLLWGGTLELHANSYAKLAGPENALIILPNDGPATIEVFCPGCSIHGQLRSSEIVIPKIPADGNLSILKADSNYVPLNSSTITLQEATYTQIGSAHRVLALENCDDCRTQTDILGSNTLIAPPSMHQLSFNMRWGSDGLYVLTVPLNWCETDLDFDGQITFYDISAFISHYQNESPWANFTHDQEFNFSDISAFINLYISGCP